MFHRLPAIRTYFDKRINYDEGSFHPQLAHKLIEKADIQLGQKILDMATGTGLVAIEAAKLVGNDGEVLGVDTSPGMLQQAQRKIATDNLNNITLLQADAETIDLPINSFHRIMCCSALPYFSHPHASLKRWKTFLKPDGLMALTGFSETSFVHGLVLREVAQKYGVNFPSWNGITGNQEKCESLLKEVGFPRVEVTWSQFGSYLSLSEAQKSWEVMIQNPLCHPLPDLDSETLEAVKADYNSTLESLVTKKGIWNEITSFFILGYSDK